MPSINARGKWWCQCAFLVEDPKFRVHVQKWRMRVYNEGYYWHISFKCQKPPPKTCKMHVLIEVLKLRKEEKMYSYVGFLMWVGFFSDFGHTNEWRANPGGRWISEYTSRDNELIEGTRSLIDVHANKGKEHGFSHLKEMCQWYPSLYTLILHFWT